LQIKQSFTVARPLAEVWALFQDVPDVAGCMPGAELLADKGGGVYHGRVSMKLGPFSAAFEGDAEVTDDAAAQSGHVEGKGTDKRGGSRSKLVLDYRLADASGGTRVDIDADIQLAGPIAQVGRTGIVNETASVLIRQFVANVEAKLTAMPASAGVAASASAAASVTASTSASTSAAASVAASGNAASMPGSTPARGAQPANQISALRLLGAVIASFLRRLFGRTDTARR
jgi:carbon monoxide dehydrogenase subunit G